MEEFLLPMFPRELILLAEEVLPLHIVEERERARVGASGNGRAGREPRAG